MEIVSQGWCVIDVEIVSQGRRDWCGDCVTRAVCDWCRDCVTVPQMHFLFWPTNLSFQQTTICTYRLSPFRSLKIKDTRNLTDWLKFGFWTSAFQCRICGFKDLWFFSQNEVIYGVEIILCGSRSVLRNRRLRGLRRVSVASRLLRLRVRIPRAHGCLSVASVVCCQVDVTACGWSLVQKSLTECGVSEWDRETWIARIPRLTSAVEP